MTALKNDEAQKQRVKATLTKIIDQLEEVDSQKAYKFSDWLLRKSRYYKSHSLRKGFGDVPNNISRGDVVRIDFGINVGDEYSDENQDCHFGLVWARQGYLLVIIPLTKTPQIKNDLGVNLGKIPQLPEDVDTWAKLESIRSVSIRRIKRMNEFSEGKFSLLDSEAVMSKINQKIMDQFIIKKNVLTAGTN